MHTAILSWATPAGTASAALLVACSGSKVCETNATQACGNIFMLSYS